MANENEMDLGLSLGTSSSNQQQVELESSGAGAGAGANANLTSRIMIDKKTFVRPRPLTELVWSSQNGLSVKCAAGCNPSCLLSPSQHEKYENDGEMKCLHFIEMEKESMANLKSIPIGDVAGPSEVGPLHNQGTADLLPLLASEPEVLRSKTENVGDGLGLDIGLPLKIQEPPQVERDEDDSKESGSRSAPSPEKMEETAENDVLIAKDANLKNVEKDLVPGEIESKMREESYRECSERDEEEEEEEDKSHGSMESCNSANLSSKKGNKRWRFEQQLIIGSKRIKKRSQECLFSTPVVKQDSSFMNWISNMVKGIKPSQQEPHSLALSSIDHHHHSVDDDHKINSVGKKMGFQTVFQSLYSQDAKRVETKNKSVGGSKEIVLFDSNNNPDDILNQKAFGNLWIARFSPKTPATLLSSSTDDASASVGLKQLEEPVAETLKTSTCLFCGKRGHELHDCLQINEKEVEGLLKNVRLYKGVSKEVSCLCIKCFQLNHWASACPYKRSHKTKEGRADLKLNEIPKHPGGKMLGVPKEMFDTIRRLRLSRTDILKWMNSRLPISSLDGYFVRLRLAKWEEGVGGAGYYVGRITGSKKPICVDIGGVECLVESRYISNCDFLEDEVIGWWRTMLTSRRRLPIEEELASKLEKRKRWRPVARTVSLQNLPDDNELPRVDVFICTADPSKEPTVEVMNTVLSAMGLDYPSDKLAVYLSDDGGAPSTLYAIKEACSFAKGWLPFCRKYGIKSRCPEWFFSTYGHDELLFRSDEFEVDEDNMKLAYERFKENVEQRTNGASAVNDRPARIAIIHDNRKSGRNGEKQVDEMPLVVYVSREKRPSLPHRFKAGALNTLLRVSGVLSNAPYMLVLDCDMYCNEPTSAKQAMCFHLDSKISTSLAFVQYPQIFYNVSQKDIYDGQARSAYKTKYQGMDGIGGTICSGTGYYLKKKALYSYPNQQDDHLILHPEERFGESSKFIDSLRSNENQIDRFTTVVLEEAKKLATCSYEDNTKWGKEIGYSYDSLLESSFTGYLLHAKGWKSVYLYPNRPCFLGCTTIDMKDALVQLMKWSSGLLQVGLSRSLNPLIYGAAYSRMPILQTMCYAYFMYTPLLAIAFLLYGTIPQLCLLNGVPLYPSASNPWFKVFAAVYVSSVFQHLYEVVSSGGTVVTWWNEQRIYLIKCISALLFGCGDVMMKSLGFAKANFRLTNKVVDKEKMDKYEKGKFDFEGAKMFMIPMTVMVLLNGVCFLGGVKRVISNGNLEEMFGQVFMSWTTLLFSYPILKGLVPSGSKGKKIKS